MHLKMDLDECSRPCISVLIRVRNEANALQYLLERLAGQKVHEPFEVVVLDNESDDDSAKVACAEGARVYTLPVALFGYGRAINAGAKLCKADLIVLLSAHAWPQGEHWLQDMIDCLVDDPALTAAYCRQMPDGRISRQERARFAMFPERDYKLHRDWFLRRCNAKEDVYEICCFSNSACIIRRDGVLRFPFRDLPYAEDRAFALDCIMAGQAIAYLSTVRVVYERPDTIKTLYRASRSAQIAKQLIRELATAAMGRDMGRSELGRKMATLTIKPVAIAARAVEALIRDRAQWGRAVRYAFISMGITWGLFVGELTWRRYRNTVCCDTSALRTAERRAAAENAAAALIP